MTIKPYTGEKNVVDLDFYPIFYRKNQSFDLDGAKLDGKKLVDIIQERRGFYNGWTLTREPSGEPLCDSRGEEVKSPDHIDSEILDDYEEAFNTYPFWKNEFETKTADVHSSKISTLADEDYIEIWPQSSRSGSTPAISPDMVVNEDGINAIELGQLLESDQYLTQRTARESKFGPNQPPTEDDLVLLPRRFIAYAIRERRFVHLDIRSFQGTNPETDDEPFEKLEIQPQYKMLIQSLVSSHFQKKDIERDLSVNIHSQDLIRGKGKGVIILLHGVPGVGKTATAEVVAQKWKKPLFPITCGDLGITAESVENTMNEIFRLAHLWDCVLLLDEADVFITQREKGDLKRNALVSAFLRMLEYYNGILFLTTNRVGVIDEAVKSRVHLTLNYKPLTEEQTVRIFRLNIERLKEIEKQRSKGKEDRLVIKEKEILAFAKKHFKKHAADGGIGRWNGRQIRNAFLIASSLAHYDDDNASDASDSSGTSQDEGSTKKTKRKKLGKKSFKIIEETTLEYDRYRMSVLKKTDDENAYEREARDELDVERPSKSKGRKQDAYSEEQSDGHGANEDEISGSSSDNASAKPTSTKRKG